MFKIFVYCSEYKLIGFLNDVKQWHFAVKAVSTFCGVYLNLHMVLRRIFGPRRDEVTGEIGDCITRSAMICTPHPILCG